MHHQSYSATTMLPNAGVAPKVKLTIKTK